MKFTRQRFQRGYLRRVPRANNKTAWEYRYKDPTTGKEKSMYLSTEQVPTQVAVERHVEAFVLKLNSENPTLAVLEPRFSAVLDRFIDEERMLEIKKRRPGGSFGCGRRTQLLNSRFLTQRHQACTCEVGNHLHNSDKAFERPEMAEELGCRTETKGHVKAIMHRL